MAIVIDFTGKAPPTETPCAQVAEQLKPADLKPVDYRSCKHGRTIINEERRTVTCSDCETVVDPFAYILLLYGYYETRIDNRLAAIRQFERRAAEREDQQRQRKQQPRRQLIERRHEAASRAAYNEYQAKLLNARAERQRQLVDKLDHQITGREVKA